MKKRRKGMTQTSTGCSQVSMMAEQTTGTRDHARGEAVPLDIKGTLGGMAGVRVLGVTISNVPPGGLFSSGEDNGEGVWSLSETDLDGLTFTPSPDGMGETILAVSVVTRAEGAPPETPPTTLAFGVTVPAFPGAAPAVEEALVVEEPLAEPEIQMADAPEPGPEIGEPAAEPSAAEPPAAEIPPAEAHEPAPAFDGEGAIALEIDTGFAAADVPDDLRIFLSGVPAGARLSAGVDNDGVWTLTAAELDGLALQPPPDFAVGFIIGIAVTTRESLVASGSLMVEAAESPAPEPVPEPVPELAREAGPELEPGRIVSSDVDDIASAPGLRPVAYWKLDEASGESTVDETGGHHGRVFGGAEGDGGDGGAFAAVAVFDGLDDYIEVSDSSDLVFPGGTLTAWFSAYAVGSGSLLAKGLPEGGGRFSLTLGNGRLEFQIQSAAGAPKADLGSFGVNEWNQITLTWGPGGLKAYLNGDLAGSDDQAQAWDGNQNPWIFGAAETGDDASPIGDFFHGELDDIALYDEPLTGAEVRNLCQIGVEGLMTGETPAEIDSGLDLSAIPAEASGPESLGTLDTPSADIGDAEEPVPPPPPPLPPAPEAFPEDGAGDGAGDVTGDVAGDGPADSGEAFDFDAEKNGWSDQVVLTEDGDGGDEGAGAISLSTADGLSIEGGEKLEW
jgi:hypothetical protein